MSLTLLHPQETLDQVTAFLQQTFEKQHKKFAVIGVSGGIDSALALTLLCKALGPEQVWPVLMPYGQQDTSDAQTICQFNQVPSDHIQVIPIDGVVASATKALQLSETDSVRKGNLMARARMMVVFDQSKKLDALVCGTENKSEHYLGYFTRFGDAASDLEPLTHLYKTQVRQLAEYLKLPTIFLQKPPSAGLWIDQTDETEMGFSYQAADQVLEQLIDQKKNPDQIQVEGVGSEVIQKVVQQVEAMAFKRQVPYVPLAAKP